MIALFKFFKDYAEVVVVVVLYIAFASAIWAVTSYIDTANENARLAAERKEKIAELDATIAGLKEKVKQHNAEVTRLEVERKADRAYYASLQNKIKKLDRFVAPLPPSGRPLPQAGDGRTFDCHENDPDPVIAADVISLRNAAAARLR